MDDLSINEEIRFAPLHHDERKQDLIEKSRHNAAVITYHENIAPDTAGKVISDISYFSVEK